MFNPRGVCRAAIKSQPYRSLFQANHIQKTYQIHPIASLRNYSTQGYGDDKGDPHAEDPQAQGVSERSRELEHPGPPQHKKKSSDSQSSGSESGKGQTKEKPNSSGSAKGRDKK